MLLKDYYDVAYVRRLSRQIGCMHPSFAADCFRRELCAELADQCFSEKLELIARGLHRHLPDCRTVMKVPYGIAGRETAFDERHV